MELREKKTELQRTCGLLNDEGIRMVLSFAKKVAMDKNMLNEKATRVKKIAEEIKRMSNKERKKLLDTLFEDGVVPEACLKKWIVTSREKESDKK